MPKKFKGENTKAALAKEKKSAAREVEEREKKKIEEDEYWRDDDKHVVKKQGRKEDRERRRHEQLERKQEAKLMLEQEEEKLGGGARAVKVTCAQISKLEEEKRQKETEGATALPRGVVLGPDIDQNPNHLLRERMERGEIDARTVEDAIDVLSTSRKQPDKNPEKRLKAAFAAFEEREFPRLKAENPNMRQSQVKQLLRKEWMKSPENPMNRSFDSISTARMPAIFEN